jgi:hypothetical protein
MTPLEELLRRSYAAAAQTVTRDDIAPEVTRLEAARPVRRRRRLAIAVLAAAATAVVALVAALLPGLLARPAAPPPAGHRPGHAPAPAGFFVQLMGGNRATVQIRSAVTGRLTATVATPSKGEFVSAVAAGGPDGRTILLAVEHDTGCRTWLYEVRLSAAGRPGRLRPAAIRSVRGILPEPALAAAADGSAVAFAAYFCNGKGRLEVDRLAPGGGSASWTTSIGDQLDSLSLSSGGAAVSVSGFEYGGTGPGTLAGTTSIRERAATAVLSTRPAKRPLDGQGIVTRRAGVAALSPNGKALYTCTVQGKRKVLRRYDVATRALRQTVARWTGSCSFALNATGTYALISTVTGQFGRIDLRTGRLTLLSVSSVPYPAMLAW